MSSLPGNFGRWCTGWPRHSEGQKEWMPKWSNRGRMKSSSTSSRTSHQHPLAHLRVRHSVTALTCCGHVTQVLPPRPTCQTCQLYRAVDSTRVTHAMPGQNEQPKSSKQAAKEEYEELGLSLDTDFSGLDSD